jgi:hypothetical protein
MNERQSVTELQIRKRRLQVEIADAVAAFQNETGLALGRDLEISLSSGGIRGEAFLPAVCVDVKVTL